MKPLMLGLFAACALVAGACSNASDTSSGLPTSPTGTLVTENFSGTVQVGSNDVHPFTVTTASQAITIDLTSAGPPATITMGFGIGAYVAGSCQLFSGGYTNAPASATPQLSGSSIAAGQYCFMVYDAGNQSAAITYTAVLTHY